MRSLTTRFAVVPRWLRVGLLLLLTVPVLAACTDDKTGSENNRRAVESREDAMERAESLIPVPENVNFPMRQALADFVVRQDMVNHPWYTYLMGYDGNYIGYFVGQTYPINACNFLSSSERVVTEHEGTIILTAPSIDGMFYGGGGASAGCTSYFFFDVATGAVLVFDVPAYVASDVPLALDVPRLNVASPEQVAAAAGDGSIEAAPVDPIATPAAVTP